MPSSSDFLFTVADYENLYPRRYSVGTTAFRTIIVKPKIPEDLQNITIIKDIKAYLDFINWNFNNGSRYRLSGTLNNFRFLIYKQTFWAFEVKKNSRVIFHQHPFDLSDIKRYNKVIKDIINEETF